MMRILAGFSGLAVWLIALVVPAQARLQWHSVGPGGGGEFESAGVSKTGRVFVGSDLSGIYSSYNGGQHWQIFGHDHGLDDTHVDSVAVDPTREGTVISGNNDGLYVTTDCGSAKDAPCHFERKFEGMVSAVAAGSSSKQDAVFYAAGLPGYCQLGPLFWRSSEHGARWEKARATGLPANANIMAIRVQPNKPDRLIAISTPERAGNPSACGPEKWLVAAPHRAYYSRDGGQTFQPINIPISNAVLGESEETQTMPWAFIEDAKFDVADNSRIWVSVSPNPSAVGGSDVSADGELWMGDADSLRFRKVSSQHTGQIWPLSTGDVRLLDLRRQRPWHNRPTNATDETGFWQWRKSDNSFAHVTPDASYQKWDMGWNGLVHAPLGSLNGNLQTFVGIDDNEAWWIDEQFVFKTVDGGLSVNQQTSTPMRDGFTSRKIDNAVAATLEPNPVNPNKLTVGYFDMGCWQTSAALASEATVGFVDCNGPKSILQQGKPLANSPLNGWWEGFGGNTTAVATDPVDANIIWAVHSPHGQEHGDENSGYFKIERSADGFKTWVGETHDLNALDNASAITALVAVASQNGRRIWAIAGNRLYRLDEGSSHWVSVATDCDGAMLVLAGNGLTLLAGGSNGVCFSHDAGLHWAKQKSPFEAGAARAVWWGSFDQGPQGVTDFAFDPSHPAHVWMTVMRADYSVDQIKAGVYQSFDTGETWEQVQSFAPAVFERNFTRSVAVDPADPNIVVVGTSSASAAGGYFDKAKAMGAFISRDGGRHWSSENDGLAWPFITKLRFTGGANPRLFGISPGQGVVFSAVR